MSVRDRRAATLSTQSTAAEAHHLGGSPLDLLRSSSIDEGQMRQIAVRLRVEPDLSEHGDVWPLLLAGVRRFSEFLDPLRV